MVRVVRSDVEKHAVCMMAELHRMKQDSDHCDFIIQVGDDVYHTHKNILSAGSAYFRAMLKHDTKESREGRVVFKDVDSECVKSCIDFIYSGEFEIPDGSIVELLHIAMMMQLDDVKQAVSNILADSLTIENYFSTRNAGDIYGLAIVSSRCKIFLLENILKISNQPGFESIEKGDLLNLLKSRESKLCEDEKLALSLKWINKCQSKNEYLHEYLEVIKFDQISSAYLLSILETHPHISNNFELYKLITGHILKARQVKAKENNDADKLVILFDWYQKGLWSLNPMNDNIEKFHEAELEYDYFAVIALDSYIYAFCGDKSVHRLDSRQRRSEWQKVKDMICDHGLLPCSVSLRGSIILIGGSDRTQVNNVEIFDPLENRWFQLQNMPIAICSASLVSLDDSVYCVGGVRDGFEVASFRKFTPSTSEWVDLEAMRYPVCGCGVVAIGRKIFVTGGWSGGDTIRSVACYNVASSQWTSLPSMNSGHGYNTAYCIGNWIFVVDRFGKTDDIEKYDLLNKEWHGIKKDEDQSCVVGESAMVKI